MITDASCLVGDQAVSLGEVYPRSLGFGKAVRDRPTLTFELTAPLAPAVSALRKSYAELRDDDDPVDDADDPVLTALRNLGWPDLEDLARDASSEFGQFVVWALPESIHRVFEALEQAGSASLRFAINTVDHVESKDGVLRARGTAYEVGTRAP